MKFGNPFALFGLLLTGVPILMHLIGRRQARRLKFPALSLLINRRRRTTHWLRVRQWLLLAARVGVVALIVLAMSKPSTESRVAVSGVPKGTAAAVVIIDDTMSMAYRSRGQVAFDSAKREARMLLDELGPQTAVALIRSTKPDVVARFSRDRRATRVELDRMKLTYKHADLVKAIEKAEALLTGNKNTDGVIVVVSDLARHGFPTGTFPKPEHSVVYRQIGDDSNGNAAVVDLKAQVSASDEMRFTVSARICNYGKSQTLRLELQIDANVSARGSIALKEGQCGLKTFDHHFAERGYHTVTLRLPEDALDADNERYLGLNVARKIRVMLIDGEPSPIRHRDELFYVKAALGQDRGSQSGHGISIQQITPDQLSKLSALDVDVVILANVSAQDKRSADLLHRFVDEGGGLLIGVGTNVEPIRYNEWLAGLLPQPLRGEKHAVARVTGDAPLRLGSIDSKHPVIRALGGNADVAALARVRAWRTMRVSPVARSATSADRRSVLVSFDDQSPALITRQVQAGTVALLTTTLDRDWSDLAIRPGFLPLLHELMRYLARASSQRRSSGKDVIVGERFELPWGRATELELVDGAGGKTYWRRESSKSSENLEVPLERPGLYGVRRREGSRWSSTVRLAVNVDSRESDLQRMTLQGRHAAPDVHSKSSRSRSVPMWHLVFVLLFGLVLLESVLVRRRQNSVP